MQKIFKKRKNLISPLLSTIFLFIIFLLKESNISFGLNFDSQEILTWEYLSKIGKIPYVDVYYPYSLASYFRENSFLIQLIYIFMFFFILFTIFFLIKRVFEKNSLLYLIYATVSSILLFTFDINNFVRYGVLFLIVFFYSLVFLKNNYLNTKTSVIAGFSTGILYLIAADQIFYSVIIFSVLNILNPVIQKKIIKQDYIYRITKNFLLFLVGLVFGMLPFLIYLFLNNGIYVYIDYLVKFKDIFFMAKIPYFPGAGSFENIFSTLVLILSVMYLVREMLFRSRKPNSGFYTIFTLTIVLFVLEQKNVMRSIDKQLFPFAVLLSFLLFKELLWKKDTILLVKRSLIFFSIGILFYSIYSLKPNLSFNDNYFLKNNFFGIIDKNESYEKILKLVRDKNKYKGKIFSYPGDPAFYILFKQDAPYYLSIYEASPRYAQEKRIDYLKKNNVKYVFINTSNLAIQDNVPNYVRGVVELRYLLNNYHPIEGIREFLILEKQGNTDFFVNQILFDKFSRFRGYLLNLYWENIPRAEGEKGSYIENELKKEGEFPSIAEFNKYLIEKDFTSSGKILVFIPEKESIGGISFFAGTMKSSLFFKPCVPGSSCVFNLDNIPLFFKDRKLERVDLNGEGRIVIYKNNINSKLW